MRKQFEVMPFLIKTIRLERIFADKIFAAEFYYERAMYFDVAKRVYDVGIMLGLQSVRDMMEDKRMFLEMLGYKRLEETRRTGSDLAEKEFSDFQIFHGFCHNSNLKDAYQNMQRNYVFSEKDMLPFEFITSQWGGIRKNLNQFVKRYFASGKIVRVEGEGRASAWLSPVFFSGSDNILFAAISQVNG